MRTFRGPAADTPQRSFSQDVLEGLARTPRALSPKYFYDERGSELFEQICVQPEYYPTRTELGIMRDHGEEIAQALGPGALVVEFGSGASLKTRTLLDHLHNPAGYVPVDISGDFLRATAKQLQRDYPQLRVHPVEADFTREFSLPAKDEAAEQRLVVYFPGSTIGNFEPIHAQGLLSAMRSLVGHGGAALLGADLVKDEAELVAAYDDAAGTTAAFNKNLLLRVNTELGGTFDIDGFAHRARFDREHSRIEMWLDCVRAQVVTVSGQEFEFTVGDGIRTEFSHKYTQASFDALAARAGFRTTKTWTDPKQRFSVQLVEASAT